MYSGTQRAGLRGRMLIAAVQNRSLYLLLMRTEGFKQNLFTLFKKKCYKYSTQRQCCRVNLWVAKDVGVKGLFAEEH